jgi:hypothetical protein
LYSFSCWGDEVIQFICSPCFASILGHRTDLFA